ncbi:AraC family transcriptional regulator [Paenibacillus sp. JCM 10914]|uniref:AraC family transcriptional regulator n=1 Tax=Paenibacillus sp. JCM 10914 TaxID=1236974 RepID=UPI0003CC8247|nr:AraC family transcriptional regulator [Paenibacillus sp. JCM 10914]GAE06823.1 transcriptional regulator, AraC family [Paenibacillus sp. JCM 10914]
MFTNMREDAHEWLHIHYFTPTTFEKAGPIWPIRLGANVAKPHYHIGPRISPYYYLLCILDGEGTFRQSGGEYPLRKHDIFCLFPQVTHEYYTNPEKPLRKAFIAFDGKHALSSLNRIGLTPEKPHAASRVNQETLDIMQSYFNHDTTDYTRVSHLYQLFHQLSLTVPDRKTQHTSTPPSWLEKGRDYLEIHYADQITIERVAHHVGIERTHFSKQFQREYGCSPIHYLQRLRMTEAELLLQGTDYKMSEIAHSVGYSDLPTFSKAFKKHYGLSPHHYRQQLQSE